MKRMAEKAQELSKMHNFKDQFKIILEEEKKLEQFLKK